jgi:hypothetical protein
MNFNEWWLSLPSGRQKVLIEDKWMLADNAFQAAQTLGIKAHEGQKLLVQHILDNDKGLSDSSRVILEKLIEE